MRLPIGGAVEARNAAQFVKAKIIYNRSGRKCRVGKLTIECQAVLVGPTSGNERPVIDVARCRVRPEN